MRHLALLAIYALVAALALPSSILAQDDVTPATETTSAPPATPEPAEPAPATGEPVPAAEAPAPEPQLLADERAEAPAPGPKAIAAASGSVTIADFSFTPATITVNAGDTVTWNNNGPTPHSATSTNGAFDTGILRKGQSGSHTFDEAGTYSYFCTPHPYMKATVVVQAAQTGGGGGDSSSSGSAAAGETGTTGSGGAQAAQSADSGPALPKSGADSGALLVLGGLMLILGIAINRRAAAPSNDGG
jgi:amicyanin